MKNAPILDFHCVEKKIEMNFPLSLSHVPKPKGLVLYCSKTKIQYSLKFRPLLDVCTRESHIMTLNECIIVRFLYLLDIFGNKYIYIDPYLESESGVIFFSFLRAKRFGLWHQIGTVIWY
jgi:hypothetical protein